MKVSAFNFDCDHFYHSQAFLQPFTDINFSALDPKPIIRAVQSGMDSSS